MNGIQLHIPKTIKKERTHERHNKRHGDPTRYKQNTERMKHTKTERQTARKNDRHKERNHKHTKDGQNACTTARKNEGHENNTHKIKNEHRKGRQTTIQRPRQHTHRTT